MADIVGDIESEIVLISSLLTIVCGVVYGVTRTQAVSPPAAPTKAKSTPTQFSGFFC